MNTASKEEPGRRFLQVLKRILRDDASIQKRWDCRKRLRLGKSVKNFGSKDKMRKI